MILECPSCHTRYLVPIGLFAEGGRQVRCARCKHGWHASLPTNIDVFVPLPETEALISPIEQESVAPSPSEDEAVKAPARSSSPASPLQGRETLNAAASDAQLPAVIQKKFDIKKASYLSIKIVFLIVAVLAWPVMDRDKIVKAMPFLRDGYEFFGFYIGHAGKGLIFKDVKSELKYDGGIMRLYVDGVIHNTTLETQFMPAIQARALGPDRRIIQSWWVDPPAPTVLAGVDTPFHTEVNTLMSQTIEEVYLEFYNQDEKGNVVQ